MQISGLDQWPGRDDKRGMATGYACGRVQDMPAPTILKLAEETRVLFDDEAN